MYVYLYVYIYIYVCMYIFGKTEKEFAYILAFWVMQNSLLGVPQFLRAL